MGIVLIGGDSDTRKEILSCLPKGCSLEEFTSLEELARPGAELPQPDPADKFILVNLPNGRPPAASLESFRRAGVPLIALIDSPAMREAAFRAGFDDYLLRPFAAPELLARLSRPGAGRAAPAEGSSATVARERMAAVGRLTSFFCHTVSNSMQVIRGAIDLSLEEPNVPAAVSEYLLISRKKTVQIARTIDRLRQIYRPRVGPPESAALESILQEALSMASDELLKNNVAVHAEHEPSLPDFDCRRDRLELIFLLLFLHIGDTLGERGGGDLRVQTRRGENFLQVTISATAPADGAGEEHHVALQLLLSNLDPVRALILSERGELRISSPARELQAEILLPLGGQ